MNNEASHVYQFGAFRLDTNERNLWRAGQFVPLAPKVCETLCLLVERSGHVVTKEELMQWLWPDTFVEEANLTQHVFLLRKALGEGNGTKYIETVPRRGYRFVAEVQLVTEELSAQEATSPSLASAATSEQRIERFLPHARAGRLGKLLVGIVAAALMLGVFGWRWWRKEHRQLGAGAFTNLTLKQLTVTGQATLAALSPDGKYVAYALADKGRQSLWLRQTSNSSHIQIAEPTAIGYQWLSFARDGEHLYYTATEAGAGPALYRRPLLSAVAPERLLAGVRGPVAFAPDGQRFAFVRPDENVRRDDGSFAGETLFIANADGSGERQLATRQYPDFFFYREYAAGLAWSPDGQHIAVSAGTWQGGWQVNPVTVRVTDGVQTPIAAQRWHSVMGIAWLPDSSSLLMAASAKATAARQLWRFLWPGGTAHQVTNDLSGYGDVSLTADARALVTVQTEHRAGIWVAPMAGADGTRRISSSGSRWDGRFGLDWTPDGKLVYSSNTSGRFALWRASVEGGASKQLTDDDDAIINLPIVSPDGRYIVLATDRAARTAHIWRLDIDGGNARQLTSGDGEYYPAFSPDGRWVVYYSLAQRSLYKVSIEGGPATQLTSQLAAAASLAVAPDGELIAYLSREEKPQPHLSLALIPFAGGAVRNTLTLPLTISSPVRWTPDGRALTYIDTRDGVSNVWNQPLDGSPPRRLTDFNELRIFYFAWSRDGRQLALARGSNNSDVVLITNFR